MNPNPLSPWLASSTVLQLSTTFLSNSTHINSNFLPPWPSLSYHHDHLDALFFQEMPGPLQVRLWLDPTKLAFSHPGPAPAAIGLIGRRPDSQSWEGLIPGLQKQSSTSVKPDDQQHQRNHHTSFLPVCTSCYSFQSMYRLPGLETSRIPGSLGHKVPPQILF